MAWDAHIHVCFSCDENGGVAKLAQRYLSLLSLDAWDVREARWFLESLAGRSGYNPGPKGGLSLWGITGNYTDGGKFVDILRPFWTDLLRGVPGGPLSFEHILVFVEAEQSEACGAYELSLAENVLCVTYHDRLPFAFMQM